MLGNFAQGYFCKRGAEQIDLFCGKRLVGQGIVLWARALGAAYFDWAA
ncbi:hypothetical protein Z948_53 [Sulfitobacter donghicola DSW-25 = KCTC 12864 = JCM 14565]|nr:hypothetical protein Z948_53 [Sulfitobacter donghicola DSW-25 = KCTC 12864 = JCM 14565]